MARTLEPNKEVDDFIKQSNDSFNQYSKLWALMPSEGHNTEKQQLAVDAAFRLGIQWETFRHRWFVASISKKPDIFVKKVQSEVDKGAEKIRHLLYAMQPRANLTFPLRPTREQIEASLDPDGYNITFTDHQKWASMASSHLDSEYVDLVRNIASDAEQTCIIDLLTSIRNYVAHQSQGSLARFNECIRPRQRTTKVGLVGSTNLDVFARDERGVGKLGPYLHRWVQGDRRVGHLNARVQSIAQNLMVV